MITENDENWVQNQKEDKRNSFIYYLFIQIYVELRLMEIETWKWVLVSGHREMLIKEKFEPLERHDQCYASVLLIHQWHIKGKQTEDHEIR